MANRNSIEAQIDVLATRLDALIKQAAKLEALPEEPESPFEDGTLCVFFQLQFNSSSPWYSYAATKAAGLWYTTARQVYNNGRATQQLTWDDLIEWITSQKAYRLFLVTGMEQLL